MRKFRFGLYLFIICTILLCGCGKEEKVEKEIISGQEAKVEVINNSALLVDVRTEEEYNQEHISGAVLLPLDEIEEKASEKIPSKDKIIIVYCNSGSRSKQAQEKLSEMGYETVYNLGAMSSWYE